MEGRLMEMRRWVIRIFVAVITAMILSHMDTHYTEVPMRR